METPGRDLPRSRSDARKALWRPSSARLRSVIRFLVRTAVYLVAGAVGLIVAAAVLDDMTLSAKGFILAVLIFGVVQGVMGPFVATSARRNARALLGATGLIATFIALLVTDLVSDSLDIEGAGTWVLATLIVWIAGILASLLLPVFLVKKGVEAIAWKCAVSRKGINVTTPVPLAG